MPSDETETEYRLTYLAQDVPIEVRKTMPERLIDFYIPDNPGLHPRLRLRRQGGHYEMTKKALLSQSDRSLQGDQTIALDRTEFESLLAGHSRKIEKDRYRVVIGRCLAEVDVFSGELTGLVLIDFRFINQADRASFSPPTCCLADVTQEPFVAGGELAGKSYQDISNNLAKYGYRPLNL